MGIENYVAQIIRASLDNNLQMVRTISTKIIRNLKNDNPQIASEISEALNYNASGLRTVKSLGYESTPQDMESKLELLKITEPIDIETPIYSKDIEDKIKMIINERKNICELVALGLKPTSSILLYGKPGVGKTLLAQYLSGILNIKFAVLDMSSAISSYLGKTGKNLKKAIDYAKEQPTVLLLDEFDAIAKRRDDTSDLGELKRVVNILLKELEDWPENSILIAATNHPELLDNAIWRRFDISINIPMPDEKTRKKIFISNFKGTKFEKTIIEKSDLLGKISIDMSAADIAKVCEKAQKRYVLYDTEIFRALIIEIADINNKGKEFNKTFCKIAKNECGMTYREMAKILDKSISAIQNYIKERGK